MTIQRSEAIREVENDLRDARARGMIRTPKFAGRTYTEVKAERHKRMQVYKVWAIGAAVLIGMGLAVGMVLLP